MEHDNLDHGAEPTNQNFNVRTTVVVCEGAKWIFRAGTCAIPTAYRLIQATRPKSAAEGVFFDELLILWLYLFPVDILPCQQYDDYSQNRRCTLRTLSDTPERVAGRDNLLQSTLTQYKLDSNREVARAHASFDDLLPRSFFNELFKKCLDRGVSLYQLTSSPVSNWRDELQNIFLHWFYHQCMPLSFQILYPPLPPYILFNRVSQSLLKNFRRLVTRHPPALWPSLMYGFCSERSNQSASFDTFHASGLESCPLVTRIFKKRRSDFYSHLTYSSMSNSPVSDPPSTPRSGSPSGESDFPSSLTGSVPRSPTTTTSLRCSFDDVPDEILWVIFSYVGSFLSRLPILGVLRCCHRFRRIALPLLYRNLEFTTPRRFVQMRDAWAMVPKVFEQHVTTVTLGCIDSHHYPIHFDVLWPDITTFTWALTSLTVLCLTGITLSFDFFLFTTSSLTRNIEATLEGCVVNREALNPVIELHFSKLTIFDIRWKKHALGDVQDGAGPIIVNLIVRCPDLTLARIPVDRSLIIHVLTWRVFKWPRPLTDLEITFIWPAKRQAKMVMAATVLKLLKKNAPLNSVSFLHDSEGFAML
ncbi:hypothetical protein F5879DRAFT_927247, partial [Lentinula edodes]